MRAFLGTGRIGGALALAAVRRGQRVVVWNRTAERAAPLIEQGCLSARTPEQAVAEAEVVHLALPSDAEVDGVMDQLVGGLGAEAVVVDHSTTSPEGASGRCRRWNEAGVGFLHAPVFMSPQACLAATGVMLVSGPEDLFERVAPALRPMTGSLVHVGEEGHEAATLKLAGNAMILAVNAGLADAMRMAAAQGVRPDEVMGLFDHLDLGVSLKGRGGRMARGDRSVSWTLAMARKDLGLMQASGKDAPLPLLDAVGAHMDRLIEEGRGEEDLSVLAHDLPRG